jgi:hypothetical protein
MKTISVKQPWAYLICSGIKDIENRSWKTDFRGRVLIHAPTNISKFGWEHILPHNEIKKSSIIGSVEIIDCVKKHSSIWAEQDKWNWVLKDPILFNKPINNIKGKLSFWNYDTIDEYTKK